ncbi:MAG: hypothetical protein GY940_30285 [bacterium]|nr:hypothetical protein [bacterium]
MKKYRIEFKARYTPSPLSFWVHKHLDSDVWSEATRFEPDLPKPVPNKGFPILLVNALGVELMFSSIPEARHFLEVISRKNMPTSSQLSALRNVTYGPNRHWLSRLPASLKPWSKREKIIPLIKSGINDLKAMYS